MEPVTVWLGIYGAANTSLALLERIVKVLRSFRKRLKNVKDFPAKLDKLIELSDKITEIVTSIKTKADSHLPNVPEAIASGLINVFKDEVEQNVKDADAVLKKLEKCQETSAGPSSRMKKFQKLVVMTTKMDSISKVLGEFESCLSKALDAASNFEVHRLNLENYRLNVENYRINTENQLKLEEVIWPRQTKAEEFEPHFDCPELPDNLVVDFGSTRTQEGRLLRKLLKLREKESVNGLSAVGRRRGSATHGMGGVGKTTALRAICYVEEVKNAFPDGICFLEFGENAKDINVQRQVERCIENFGGVSIVEKMEQQSSLEGAIHQAARWLRKKEVLFVCDDLWRSPTNEFGYLPLLKGLLVNAPRSKLLISTRDKRIAENLSKNNEPFGTLPPDGLCARNLVGLIAFGDKQIEILKKPDIQGHFGTILKVCAGLQLALCMAGHALRTAVEEQGSISRGLEVYASQLERDQRPDDTEGSAQLYDHGLSYIVEASLVQCRQWAETSLKTVNVQNFFRSLCILEKQMVMPKSMLSNLWGLDSRETDIIVRMFANLGLVTKTKYRTSSELSQDEVVENYGVRLHDLVLVLCQEMVGDEQKQWHQKFIGALERSKSVWMGEKIPAADEWWNLKNSAYIYENLSRHMVKGGCEQALANLLSDVRWTQRRIEVGGWLALKTDYELLLIESGHAEFADMRLVYEVLKRYWSEVSKNERLLTYYVGGSLSREEREKKCTARYTDSMMRYLTHPLLVPRWKFLGPQDSREISILTCQKDAAAVCMDFSNLGELAVVARGGQISLWSVAAQKELWFMDSKFMIFDVAISANGRLIVSNREQGIFQEWNAKSGEPIGCGVRAHSGYVSCIAINKDCSTIATGSTDKILRLSSAMNGEPKGISMYHKGTVKCLAIFEGRGMIVSGSEDGSVCRWNTDTGEMIGEPMCGHKGWVNCVSVDENSKMIVSGSSDSTLLRWDATTGDRIGNPICGHSGSVQCVAISPCGRMILSGFEDGTLRIWNAVNGESMGEPFRGHFSSIESVAFTEESEIIVSGSTDGTIRRWITVPISRINEPTPRCDGEVRHIMFSDGGQKLVTCSSSGTLFQWDATNGKPIGIPMKPRVTQVGYIAVNEKCSSILAVCTTYSYANWYGKVKNEIIRWNTSTCEMEGEPILLKHGSHLSPAAVSSNGEIMVTGLADGTIQRWCTKSGYALGEPMRGHKRWVHCIAFSANGEMLVTGSDDGSIIRWATANGDQIGKPLLQNGSIDGISISADGMIIVTSVIGGGLYRWDANTGRLKGKFLSNEWYGGIISTNYDCTKIATWRNEDMITCWDVEPEGAIRETSTLLASVDITACAIDLNRDVAALGTRNGAVVVCDIHEQFDSVAAVRNGST